MPEQSQSYESVVDELERLRSAGDALSAAAAAIVPQWVKDPRLSELYDANLSWRAARSFEGA